MVDLITSSRKSFVRIGWVLCMLGLAGCTAQSRTEGLSPAPGVAPAQVFWTPPPWAYRIGPEVLGSEQTDTARIRMELGTKAAALGCDAVVSIVIPPANATSDRRPWGFCAYRVR